MTTTDGRGGIPGVKSGQRVAGSSNVDSRPNGFQLFVPSTAGCCTATVIAVSPGRNRQPQTSAPTGTRKNMRPVPRDGPSVCTAQTPSAVPETFAHAAPWSVPTHRRPRWSIAMLSGQENQPFSLVFGFHIACTSGLLGSPQRTSTSHAKRAEPWSPPALLISTMWPHSFRARGLTGSGPG